MSGNFTDPHRTRAELEALDKGHDYDAERLESAAAHIRSEADFNRSWADGRRQCDNEAVKAKRLQFANERDAWADAIEKAGTKTASLAAENARLRRALAFYADEGNHGHFGSVESDNGFTARQALSRFKDKDNG